MSYTREELLAMGPEPPEDNAADQLEQEEALKTLGKKIAKLSDEITQARTQEAPAATPEPVLAQWRVRGCNDWHPCSLGALEDFNERRYEKRLLYTEPPSSEAEVEEFRKHIVEVTERQIAIKTSEQAAEIRALREANRALKSA